MAEERHDPPQTSTGLEGPSDVIAVIPHVFGEASPGFIVITETKDPK